MERGIKLPQSPSEWGFKGENYLLIIGIDKYTQWKPLHNAVKDVRDVSKLLTDRYQFEPDKVFTLFDEEATKDKIREKLIYVKRTIKKEDNLVIYFSGHGFYDEEIQEGYWVPVNATKNNPSDYISNSDMLRLIKSIQSHHVLILVDSCFSGSLVSESRGEVLSEKFPSCRIFASGRLELVEDGVAGSNSPFAAAVLRGLSRNTDRVMRSSDLIQNVIKVVESEAGQAPVEGRIKDAGDQGGEFVFYLKSSEEEIWKSVVLNDKKEEYEKYLDYFPEGQYIRIAKSKLSSFDEDRDWRQAERNLDIDSIRNYLNKHPEGNHYDEALKLLNKLEEENLWSSARRLETEYAYRNYLRKYQNGQYADLARKYLEEINKPVSPEPPKPEPEPLAPKKNVEPEKQSSDEIKSQVEQKVKKTESSNDALPPEIIKKSNRKTVLVLCGICIFMLIVPWFYYINYLWNAICIPLLLAILILNRSNKTIMWVLGGFCILFLFSNYFIYHPRGWDGICILFLIAMMILNWPRNSVYGEGIIFADDDEDTIRIVKSSNKIYWFLGAAGILLLMVIMFYNKTHDSYNQNSTKDYHPVDTAQTVPAYDEEKGQNIEKMQMESPKK